MYGALRVAGTGTLWAGSAYLSARAGDEHGRVPPGVGGQEQCVPPTVFVGGTRGLCWRGQPSVQGPGQPYDVAPAGASVGHGVQFLHAPAVGLLGAASVAEGLSACS